MCMTREELLALIDPAAAEGWTELDLAGHGLTLRCSAHDLAIESGHTCKLKGRLASYGVSH
jgi:hypothetical protein